MSDDKLLVLDNTVLSAYYVADWVASLNFWQDRYNITTTGRVWNNEFKPHHELSETPEWLSIRDGDIDTLSITGIGQLGEVDWSCIALASSAEDNRLVTNDYPMKQEAKDRDIEVEWGTHFAIRTFRECGLSEAEFENGLTPYIDDVHLPEDVIEEMKSTEKD